MHWFVQQWDLIDKAVLILFLYGIALGLAGGWALCQVTHKQRGIEVDRPLSDNLPGPPPPIVVPDHVPAEWDDDDTHVRVLPSIDLPLDEGRRL